MRTSLKLSRCLAFTSVTCLGGCSRTPAVDAGLPDAEPVHTRTVASQQSPDDARDGGLIARKLPRTEYRGGPFLRHPRVVTVTFRSDDARVVARLEQFAAVIPRSSWWHTVIDGYCAGGADADCIGDGQPGVTVRLDDALAPAVNDEEVEALVIKHALASRLGPIDESTLILVYLPKDVRLSQGATSFCERGPRAFHRSFELNGRRVPFAVLPRCGDETELTATASHELLEATTNPVPFERGFAFVGSPPQIGFVAAGVEPVDPCGLLNMNEHRVFESGFVVQRAWSNRSASAGHDPCVPARPTVPYMALVPRVCAVRLPSDGDTATVDLDATAVRPLQRWSASAIDLTGYQDGVDYVDVSLDRASVVAGDVVRLTIRARKRPPSSRAMVGLVSTIGVHSHMWPLVVTMR